MHSTITVSYDFCWFKSFSFALLFIIIIIIIIIPWDARDFVADIYSLNYSAGDAVTANLVQFECL
jgi:hypothetical protein